MPNLHFPFAYTNSLLPAVHTLRVGCWWLTTHARHAVLPGSEDDRGPADEKAAPQEGLRVEWHIRAQVQTENEIIRTALYAPIIDKQKCEWDQPLK